MCAKFYFNTFRVLLLFFFYPPFVHTSFSFFVSLFCGQLHIETSYQQKQRYIITQDTIKQFHSKIQDDPASEVLCFDRNLPANK